MVLREKGLPYVRHTVGTAPAEVRKLLGDISPRGEVPVLMDLRPPGISNKPVVLHDSSVICEYLDEAYPANPVFPKDPALRSKCRIIDDAMDTHLEGVTWALNEVFAFNRAGPSGSPLRTKIVSAAMAEIKVWYAWLEQQLDGSQFLCGDQFSYADISAASILMGTTSYRALPEKGSQLEAWWNLVSARPSVKEIIQVGGFVSIDWTQLTTVVM
jgi:glutathione S-transferase